MNDLLFYRVPNEEIVERSGVFKRIDSFSNVEGFVLSSFDKKEKFIFEENDKLGHYSFMDTIPHVQSKEEYIKSGNEFLNKIDSNNLSKAILSRVKEISVDNKPETYFYNLCLSYPDAFVYLVSSEKFGTWIGATPEILLTVEDGSANTVALAGTMGANEKADWGNKEKNEQKIVSDFVSEKLEELNVSMVQRSEVSELFAGPVKHLVSNFQFDKGNEDIAKVIDVLHPTPAVSGLPRKEAVTLINSEEEHSRSLYAGIIGLIFKNDAKLFVNLRCAQLNENSAYLYLGGGYTKDSIVEDEWQETEKKAKTLLKVLEKV